MLFDLSSADPCVDVCRKAAGRSWPRRSSRGRWNARYSLGAARLRCSAAACRAEMIAAGKLAGFGYVDLLPEPVAAALSPLVGEEFASGDTVLVYDFGGGTFDAAVVLFTGDGGYEVLGEAFEQNTGGREIDTRLVAYVRAHADPELTAALSPPAGKDERAKLTALRAGLMVEDLVRDLKHCLAERNVAEQYLTPLLPPITLSRADLEEQVKSLLDATVECCHRLLAARGVAASDLTAILQVGGSSRLPVVREVLSSFGAPVRRPEDLDLAVVLGAARWAARAPSRRLEPWVIEAGNRPLRWQLPSGEAAELERWLVEPGQIYAAEGPLGVARLQDGSLWRLFDDVTEPGRWHQARMVRCC